MEPTTSEKTGEAVSSFGERHSSLARAVEVLRVEGVRSFWFKALGQTIYRRVVVMECPFADAIRSVSAHVSVVVGLSEDVGEYVTFRPRTDPADFHLRLRSGHRCFVARHEGRIVHACWAATGRIWIEYLGRHLVLPPDSVYHYDSFTMPEFRGLNISAFRVTEAARYFRAAGYRRLVAVVAPENLAAFRPLEKAGYRRVGRMGYVRIGPWRYQFSRRSRPPHSPLPDYWDDIAAETRRRAPLDQWRAYMQRVYERLVEKWLPSSSSPGMKTDLFEEAITSYHVLPALGSGSIGLDCSSATVAAARARLSATGGRYLFLVADLRALPMRAGVVGRILAGSSLDHFADKAELATSLAELTRVLRPGGALLVTLDNPHNPVVWLRNHLPFTLLNRVGLVPYYVGQTYGLAEAKAQLGSLGLTVGPVAAVAHVPRAPAIWLVALGERLNAAGLLRRLGGLLDAFERLERWPTRYRTGYYLAIKAEKPFSTGRTS